MFPVGVGISREMFALMDRNSVTAGSVNDSWEDDDVYKGVISGLINSSQAQSNKPAPQEQLHRKATSGYRQSDTTTTCVITEQEVGHIDTHRGVQMSFPLTSARSYTRKTCPLELGCH